LATLRRYVCGGASVPPALIEAAAALMPRCIVSRVYGSTEVPLLCPGIRTHSDAAFGAHTDGECIGEVRIVDETGCLVPEGVSGEVLARAPQMFAGYLDPGDDVGSFTPDGFFRMGDLARRVDRRFLEITGRKKDIIIRLGENISPLEI